MKTVIGVQQHDVLGKSEELSKTIINLQHNEKFKWRNRVHDELLAAMDLRRTDISNMDEDGLRRHVEGMVKEIIEEMGSKLPADVDRVQLANEVLNEAVGLGHWNNSLPMRPSRKSWSTNMTRFLLSSPAN
ncbi:MAG: hypothetical protein O7D86_13765 [Proteobacteria bacterium]|nr:hypothetical protein [Pseudomonadota bacterium]